MKIIFRIFIFMLLTHITASATEWQKAAPNYSWNFPQDHGPHRRYQTEWWYFTGQLSAVDNPAHVFGYQFTFFRVGLLDQKPVNPSAWSTEGLIMGHAALTDISKGTHVFSHLIYRESPLFGKFKETPALAWSLAPPGSEGNWTLSWNGHAFDFSMIDTTQNISFALSTKPLKPLIFQGPNGFSQKSSRSDAASLYYSFTRLQTSGIVIINGFTFTVEGQSWMDKEFSSNQLAKNQTGWDWFSLQFDDGRELMLYVLRNEKNQTDFSRGSVISKNASRSDGVRFVSDTDWKLTTTQHWTSANSGAQYPSAWTLSLPSENIRVTITPLVADQENRGTGPGLPYWEGAVKITDTDNKIVGRGYVELTGYSKEKKLRF